MSSFNQYSRGYHGRDGSPSRAKYPGRYNRFTKDTEGRTVYIPLNACDDKRRRQHTPETFAKAKELEPRFLEVILPALTRTARKQFRKWPAQYREDLIAETIAAGWQQFLALIASPKNHDPFACIGILCKNALRQVLRFQYVTGREHRLDILSRRAQLLNNFTVKKVDSFENWFNYTLLSGD